MLRDNRDALVAMTSISFTAPSTAIAAAVIVTFTTAVLGFRKFFHVEKLADVGCEEDSAMEDLADSVGRDHNVLL